MERRFGWCHLARRDDVQPVIFEQHPLLQPRPVHAAQIYLTDSEIRGASIDDDNSAADVAPCHAFPPPVDVPSHFVLQMNKQNLPNMIDLDMISDDNAERLRLWRSCVAALKEMKTSNRRHVSRFIRAFWRSVSIVLGLENALLNEAKSRFDASPSITNFLAAFDSLCPSVDGWTDLRRLIDRFHVASTSGESPESDPGVVDSFGQLSLDISRSFPPPDMLAM